MTCSNITSDNVINSFILGLVFSFIVSMAYLLGKFSGNFKI